MLTTWGPPHVERQRGLVRSGLRSPRVGGATLPARSGASPQVQLGAAAALGIGHGTIAAGESRRERQAERRGRPPPVAPLAALALPCAPPQGRSRQLHPGLLGPGSVRDRRASDVMHRRGAASDCHTSPPKVAEPPNCRRVLAIAPSIAVAPQHQRCSPPDSCRAQNVSSTAACRWRPRRPAMDAGGHCQRALEAAVAAAARTARAPPRRRRPPVCPPLVRSPSRLLLGPGESRLSPAPPPTEEWRAACWWR